MTCIIEADSTRPLQSDPGAFSAAAFSGEHAVKGVGRCCLSLVRLAAALAWDPLRVLMGLLVFASLLHALRSDLLTESCNFTLKYALLDEFTQLVSGNCHFSTLT